MSLSRDCVGFVGGGGDTGIVGIGDEAGNGEAGGGTERACGDDREAAPCQVREAPHLVQKFFPAGTSDPQDGQNGILPQLQNTNINLLFFLFLATDGEPAGKKAGAYQPVRIGNTMTFFAAHRYSRIIFWSHYWCNNY